MKKNKVIIVLIIVLGIAVFFGQQIFNRVPKTATQNQQTMTPKEKEAAKRLASKVSEDLEGKDAKKAEEEAKKVLDDENRNSTGGGNFQRFLSEWGFQILGLIISIVGVVLAVSGFSLAGKKKQKYMQKYLHAIDNAYGTYKMKTEICEAELFKLHHELEDQLKSGAIDENTYDFLQKRIQKYMDEVKAKK